MVLPVAVSSEEAVATFEGIRILTPRCVILETIDYLELKNKDTLFSISSHNQISQFYFRGRYTVELHMSFLRLQGQANNFKIQYSSILRLFVLPKVLFLSRFTVKSIKILHLLIFAYCQEANMISCLYIQSNNRHTFLVITIDPPIRKRQTLYPHIVIQVLYYNSFHINFVIVRLRHLITIPFMNSL